MLVLIAYDIANKKRLRKVARLMEEYGVRVQKSVFECRLQPAQVDKLIERVKPKLKPREDRIHLYRICEACQARFAGFGVCGHLTEDERILIF